VLDALKDRLLINIEVKPEAFESHSPADAVERQILALVNEKKMVDDVLVSSFDWRVLKKLRQLAPTIAIGLLTDVPADDRLIEWIDRVTAFSWHPDYRVLTRAQVERVHGAGVRVFPYAVDGRIDTRGMLAMGVDGMIVDDPQQMKTE
jgi:glycerophosphoryl diester phosphodiesterase